MANEETLADEAAHGREPGIGTLRRGPHFPTRIFFGQRHHLRIVGCRSSGQYSITSDRRHFHVDAR